MMLLLKSSCEKNYTGNYFSLLLMMLLLKTSCDFPSYTGNHISQLHSLLNYDILIKMIKREKLHRIIFLSLTMTLLLKTSHDFSMMLLFKPSHEKSYTGNHFSLLYYDAVTQIIPREDLQRQSLFSLLL